MGRPTILFLIAFLLLVGFSCKKMKTNRLKGEYYGIMDGHSWDMSGYDKDTTYFYSFEIERSGKDLIVWNRTIPYDSIKEGNVYKHPQPSGFFTIQFSDDSLFVHSKGGGMGGGSSSRFRGTKK